MASVTRTGRQTINTYLEDVVGEEIQERWRANLEESQENLRGTIQVFNDGQIVQIGSRSKILRWLEYGTAPHTITPNTATTLKFEWPDAPAAVQEMFPSTFPTVFFRKVEHPGIKAYAHMRNAVEQVNQRGFP